jgi:predicted nuclease with RNAse H fold
MPETNPLPSNDPPITAVGIDVGGARKGSHAVALSGGRYADQFSTKDIDALTHWCRETVGAQVIAVDAPCRWSLDGRCRPAERELMQQGIFCFSTPTRERALAHPKNHFGWMQRGEELFQALESDYSICREVPLALRWGCFETFPHAIDWHLMGGKADARQKRTQRRALLEAAGIDLTRLTNIDLVDAALCALTAHHAATGGPCLAFGEAERGLIIVPGLPSNPCPSLEVAIDSDP